MVRLSGKRGLGQPERLSVRKSQSRTQGDLKVQANGLLILFRFPVDDGRTEMASAVVDSHADIHSWLSTALGKIVDQLCGPAKRGVGTPSEPVLIIVGMGSSEKSVIGPPVAQTLLRVGRLNLNLLDRMAKRGDRQIDLRPREFQLLRYMMERSGNC